ncbi:hypothetical protein EVAR_96345_1 [Eumeta japonica]|uniref:Uncharacterized protein n=1 Tax=Eumeta variegata TaxID=151549 RepID=A0A4C1VWD2_EUMVA|nr:hypothetical protein EVAR_96345_1 [Eumeta japonica]
MRTLPQCCRPLQGEYWNAEQRDECHPEAERLRMRIVEAAAAIIRKDIRSSIVKTKSYPPPRWNGYLEQLTKNNTNFSTSQVIFLPFIDNPVSNEDTIDTTLRCAVNIAKSHGQKTCVNTFDQLLYSKAREMIGASDANSELSNVIVKLGGFHMLMSFLGSIGYIMDGSGLEEALDKIYAENSVDKMLNGHAYARQEALEVIHYYDLHYQ